jgi:hypothetical protein
MQHISAWFVTVLERSSCRADEQMRVDYFFYNGQPVSIISNARLIQENRSLCKGKEQTMRHPAFKRDRKEGVKTV